jgi:23S rRNA (cytosine1962-C5)-methyltransferase
MTSHAKLRLKPGRESSLLRHHPWIFSGAVAATTGDPQSGETIDVLAADGRFLARAAYSPKSQILARAWSFVENEPIDDAFLARRIGDAVAAREALRPPIDSDALRLIYGESDGLPGLIVDRYADFLVIQLLSAGAERFRDSIVAALVELMPASGIFERSDVDVREKEGLLPRKGLVAGAEPAPLVMIREGTRRYHVDLRSGQKTGFYLDQRDSRQLAAGIAGGCSVLDAFSYTGGFSVAALAGGAERVVQVEDSGPHLKLAGRNVELNGFDGSRLEQVQGNVFQILRQMRQEGRRYDLVVLDPPKFVASRAKLERACRGYKDINLLAFQLLCVGGRLLTFSCSGLLETALFEKVVADAALDAGVEAVIERRLHQAADHPIALAFPEASYLKGLLLRIADR